MRILVRQKRMIGMGVLVASMMSAPSHWANAHFGGFLVQARDGYLITGFDSETPGGSDVDWNVRALGSLFSPSYYSDLPSFLSLRDPPPGTQALPPATNIYWDFLPMTANGYTSNLLYWNGQGTTLADVRFGPVPIPPLATDVTMGIYNVTDGASAFVSDTPNMVAGALLGVTDNTGSGLRLHRHNYFLLDDGDGGIPPTNVAEGVYLIALQLRMPGFGTSRPFYVVPGTYQLIAQSLDSLNAAVAWVGQNADLLIRPGDYNFDGIVNQADHMTWMAQFGSSGPCPINGDCADGNRDGPINAADYVFWRKVAGGAGLSAGLPLGRPTYVPEPSSLMLTGWAAICVLSGLKPRCW
jgi:hypothetical protein